MTILTPEQHQAIEQAGGRPVPFVDPETNVTYYLVPADVFQELQRMGKFLEEQRQRAAIAKQAKRNAAGRMDEAP